MDQVTAQWQRLAARADAIGQSLPAAARDAWFGLIGYEVGATANLYALRKAEFTNIRYAAQGRAATNDLADQAEAFFAKDQAMSGYYNNQLAGGKWNGWQTQTHIGYGDVARYGSNATWADPPLPDEIYPAVQRITVPVAADMGVAVDGSGRWPVRRCRTSRVQPLPDSARQYIDVFNRGQTPFAYTITTGVPWLRVAPASGTVDEQIRATVQVDWRRAPTGSSHRAHHHLRCRHGRHRPGAGRQTGHPSRSASGIRRSQRLRRRCRPTTTVAPSVTGSWQRIPGIGLTGAGMEPLPVTGPSQPLSDSSPRLQYTMTLTSYGAGEGLGLALPAQRRPGTRRPAVRASPSTTKPLRRSTSSSRREPTTPR